MPLTEMELEFLTEARKAGALVDINCYLGRHQQNPTGIIDVVERSTQGRMTLVEADQQIRLRRDRRSVIFGCGDCDQIHELIGHHGEWIDCQSHLHLDNGGAHLLDPRLRVVHGFNTSEYWRIRLITSVDLKFGCIDALPEEDDPEVLLYLHLSCAQARALQLMAWDSIMSGCRAKQLMKRFANKRREARAMGSDDGRPYRTGLLLHVDYGDGRKRTYFVKRHLIEPIAKDFILRHERRNEGSSRQEPNMVS